MSIHIEYLEVCTHFVTVHVMLISTYSFIFFKALDVQWCCQFMRLYSDDDKLINECGAEWHWQAKAKTLCGKPVQV